MPAAFKATSIPHATSTRLSCPMPSAPGMNPVLLPQEVTWAPIVMNKPVVRTKQQKGSHSVLVSPHPCCFSIGSFYLLPTSIHFGLSTPRHATRTYGIRGRGTPPVVARHVESQLSIHLDCPTRVWFLCDKRLGSLKCISLSTTIRKSTSSIDTFSVDGTSITCFHRWPTG